MRKDYVIVITLVVIIILLIAFKNPIKKVMTRGYKNKNPGNIRMTDTLWIGEVVGEDKDFKTFSTMPYGYRALFALLREYMTKGYDTIEKIINRYAPSNENATEEYIKTVSRKSGIPREQFLTFADVSKVKDIVAAISYVENGIYPDLNDIENGYKLLQA